MARARFIRPEFFTDEKIADMPFGAAFLFAGIWCHSDLRGVYEHSPRVLRGLIFSVRDGIGVATVEGWLRQLVEVGMLATFQSGGKTWGYVCNWSEHQQISGREKEVGSKRPAPPTQGLVSNSHVDGQDLACAASISPTLTPTPTTAPAQGGDAPAPATSRLERQREFLEGLGALTRKDGRCLMGEWAAETKKMRAESIAELFRDAVPGIQWPSQFKAWRASKVSY